MDNDEQLETDCEISEDMLERETGDDPDKLSRYNSNLTPSVIFKIYINKSSEYHISNLIYLLKLFLSRNHQTHYEQFGILQASVKIDNKNYDIQLETVRDHSFGVHREWRQFKRYGLHFFSTQKGDRFSLGQICLPINFSRLTVGYIYLAKDKKIYSVQDCDLELYQHGHFGTPPRDYAFSFTAGNKKYVVKVNVIDSPYFYISKDWEAKIFESLCEFEVNGVKGWGAAEWQYRNIEGKTVMDYSENVR
ncbi:uncharacterized protein LOC108913376 [Anoplophora glabripennis]|uniref:uncharacterized protein LOC108913376 n=1 Tax=Anoplophora glabripennis TaxID=217634 RepID=UPI000C784E0A|nr:uncharacterized protein LOC108913376 [Anoplophora glabripennis]